MACIQVFSARLPNGLTSSVTDYVGPMLGYEWTTGGPIAGVPWMVAGSFRNVSITHLSAPGAGKSYTYTFVKNGIDTALSIRIADLATSGSDTTHIVSVIPGDVVYWKRVVGGISPTASLQRVSGEFWGQIAGESGYGGMSEFNSTLGHRAPVFNQGQWNSGGGGIFNHEVVAVDGHLTAVAIRLAVGPGAGKSYDIAIYKNGVAQDGTAGTVDTRMTIANAATTGSWTGSLALTPGDYIYFHVAPTNSPAVGSNEMGCGVKFVATTDGESHGGQLVYFNLPTTGGPYYASPDVYKADDGWDASESDKDTFGAPVTTAAIYGLRVRIGTTIGTGPVTFALRLNGATTALTTTLAAGADAGADTQNSVDVGPGDSWSMQYTPTGSPGSARITSFAFVMFAVYNPSLIGSAVFGVNTRVTASRAVAFGLDGDTHVHNEENKLIIYGDFETTGVATFGSIGAGAGVGPVAQLADAPITSAQVLTLRGSPMVLVAAPGLGRLLEFAGGMLMLDAGTAYVETTDNLVVRYTNGSGVEVSQAIEATGFIDQTVDTMTSILPRLDAIVAKTGAENQALVLHNTGSGEYTTGTGTLRAYIAYRVWDVVTAAPVSNTVALTGVAAAASVGQVDVPGTVALSGVQATMAIGNALVSSDSVPLFGVAATAAVGTVSPSGGGGGGGGGGGDAIFAMNMNAPPNYGFAYRAVAAGYVEYTNAAGLGPSGGNALRVRHLVVGAHNQYTHQLATFGVESPPSLGATRYHRLYYKFVGVQDYTAHPPQGAWENKFIIMGSEGGRVILYIRATPRWEWSKNIDNTGPDVLIVGNDVWHALQVGVTSSASGAVLRSWHDNDAFGSPTGQATVEPISTLGWGDAGFGNFADATLAGSGHIEYLIGGYEYDDEFDPSWFANM